MAEYPRKHTPISQHDTARLLLNAYRDVHGALPDRNTAELYLALLWNENNRGNAVYNYNLGNVIAVGNQDFARPPWFDRRKVEAMPDGATKTRYLALNQRMTELPGTVPTKFRAFSSAEAGARVWITTLANPRYAKTRDAARAGDALEFGRQLHFEGYIADPGTDKLGSKYDSLRSDIRKAGYFQGLAMPTFDVVLRAGNSYRITEATKVRPDWEQLRAEVHAAGGFDVAHWEDGQNKRWAHFGQYVFAFTTPELAIDVVNPEPIRGGAIVAIERVRDTEPPPTTRRKGDVTTGVLVAALLLVVAVSRAVS